MTRQFALKLKAKLNCPSCSRKSAPERKFCPYHLEYARQNWRRHVTRCSAEGRCIDCPKKKLVDEQRCGSCKADNQKRCIRWYYENRERVRARWHARIRRGLCGGCGFRKAIKGHSECIVCHPKGYAR